ncbi:MAG: hypothetical protein EA360_11675 [Balneolaceae bacterium]|nr:MAG: hypothetical protein EA360_11675 [Balneolaceae bacterium]
MSDRSEVEHREWEQDVDYLVQTLKKSFESTDARYSVDEMNDILYVELEGLEQYSEDEIVEIAEPVLDLIELDFEDIVLLPFGG